MSNIGIIHRRGWMRASATMALALALAIAHLPLAFADDDDDDDRELIRRAVERGEILSLAELRRIVLARVPGEIVSTDVDIDEEDDGRHEITYEFRVLAGDSRMMEVEIDARDGRILDVDND